MIAFSNCEHCNLTIEFQPPFVTPNQVLKSNCPHCGQETILRVPQQEPPPVIIIEKIKKRNKLILWSAISCVGLLVFLTIYGALRPTHDFSPGSPAYVGAQIGSADHMS